MTSKNTCIGVSEVLNVNDHFAAKFLAIPKPEKIAPDPMFSAE